ALVAQPVFDDKPGLFLDPGLLKRPFRGLVGLVVFPWVSHGLLASFLGLLHTDSHAGPAGRLGALPADFLAGLMPDALVAADLPHHVDVFIAGKRDVATNEVLGLAGVEVLGPVCHPLRDTPGIFLNTSANPVHRLLVHEAELCVLVNPGHTGDDRGGMPADTLDAGQCYPHRLRAIQIGRADPYKVSYFFFLSHPIPSILRLSL